MNGVQRKSKSALAAIVIGAAAVLAIGGAMWMSFNADSSKGSAGKTNEEKAYTPPAPFRFNPIANYYTERYRPQYHLSVESGNMSDPNGMVYYEGEYHQFYQNSGQWGHAVSQDLVHWEHLPVALMRDELGEIWSGSAVVDWNDTSSFFQGKSGLVAIFTHFQSGVQSQSIAYSNDRGRTWTKYEGNPVIPNSGMKDFRDPKVIWHEASKRWVMVVSVDNHVKFYSSPNLRNWTETGEFGIDQGSHAAVWECPDLFELPVDGTGNRKWVLTLSVGNNETTKGSTAQYFIGEFDGKTFHNDNPADTVLWTDYGKDFYAAVSYSDIPEKDGRRIWLGWMSNWRYPFTMPTDPWKGNMSVPRELILRDIPGEGIRLIQQPVKELDSLRGTALKLEAQQLATNSNAFGKWRGTSYELDTIFTVSADAAFALKVRTDGTGAEETSIRYNAAAGTLTVDRSKSGIVSFEPGFAESFAAPVKPSADGRLSLRIYVDEATLEVFAEDGEKVLSTIVFPEPTSNGLSLELEQGSVKLDGASFYPMRSVWRDENPDSSVPSRILIGKESVDVAVGAHITVKSSVLPLAAPQQLEWTSSDVSVAKVKRAADGSGADISGVGAGQADLIAKTPDGKITATMSVFVYEP
ncbi:GH32 C-terminal domain-containing protein [Paenibacillus sp. PR3]|uniref:GH32 C-terminal domain-containing protein n=1 Tax=Paenibacillus terricola TaxID=2763503 RepID=A0ABR8MRN9_9BACL|nr:GH32 C-terminal domain-containing protein [Paenibacillus terricola]MBD3918588.1 GH32 C-terminal domain-containing protein [Paenibacillus terricola]